MTDLAKRLREALEDQTTSNELYLSAEHGTPIPDETIKRIIKDAAYPPLVDREAVIREVSDWLRDDAGKTRDDLSKLHRSKKLTPEQTEEWEFLISVKLGIADAILALIEGDG